MTAHPEHKLEDHLPCGGAKIGRYCRECGSAFSRYRSKLNQKRGIFCSRYCWIISRQQKLGPEAILRNMTLGDGGCWVWLRGKTGSGYGVVTVGGKYWLAHRLSYNIFKGGPVESARTIVRHSCDNRACVNPDHLLAGSVADNSRDAVERHRVDHGSSRYNAKLSERDIPNIRDLLGQNISCSEIGRRFGVSGRAISFIRDGKRWVRA